MTIDKKSPMKLQTEAVIQSLLNNQATFALSLLIDINRLEVDQERDGVVGGREISQATYDTDIRLLLSQVRGERAAAGNRLARFLSQQRVFKVSCGRLPRLVGRRHKWGLKIC